MYKVITEDEWEKRFTTTTEEMLVDIPEDTPNENLWTVLESDGDMVISSGSHFVNRLGYWVTKEPHAFDIDVECDNDFDEE